MVTLFILGLAILIGVAYLIVSLLSVSLPIIDIIVAVCVICAVVSFIKERRN